MSSSAKTNHEVLAQEAKAITAKIMAERYQAPTSEGRLTFGGEDYVLMPKSAIDRLAADFGEATARIVLYKVGHEMGKNQAKSLISTGLVRQEPLLRCLMRPFFYMSSGLGTVDILELSYDGNPENFHVLYEDLRPINPHMVMGYSAGWKSEMLGLELQAQQIEHPGHNLRVLVTSKNKIWSLKNDPRLKSPASHFEVLPIRL